MVSQKIQATASKKGFTLVELIVVITILAILGTIGFISIQGYSAQSRDSKRTSDLRSLASALTIKATDGIALTSFVTAITSSPNSVIAVAKANGTTVAGLALTGGLADYTAGTPNFTALGVSAANFKDGNYDYRLGTSTRDGGVFQIAATLEAGGTKTALTSGNYAARTAIQFSCSGVLNAGTSSGFTVSNLTGSGVGYFNKGDRVFVGGVLADVTSANGDGRGFVATAVTTLPTVGTTTAALGEVAAGWAEASGLIASSTGVLQPVINGSTATLPYSY